LFEEQLGETGGTIAQFGLSLIVVVALIFLVAWVVRRFVGARFGAHHGEQAELQVVDTLSIDTKRKLVLVRHGKLEHLLLIGGNSDEVIERSMVGGIPLAARMQASKAQEKQEDENYARPADRFRTTNRFSSALLRSKAGEDNREPTAAPTTSPSAVATAAAGVTAGTVGAAAAVAAATRTDAGPIAKAPPSAPQKTELQNVSAMPANKPNELSPTAQSERDALDRSLDEALSASLFDEPTSAPVAPNEPTSAITKPVEPTVQADPLKLDSLKAEPAPAPTPSQPQLPSSPTPASASASIDDLDLERELEAALELDAFEARPNESEAVDAQAQAPIDLPPLPAMPDLPDLSTLTGNGDDEISASAGMVKDASTQQSTPGSGANNVPDETPDAETEKAKTEPADPLKLSSVRDTKANEETEKPASPSEGTPEPKSEPKPAPDIPVALSGRDNPPIPVAIPSRGPAANATTLAKADQPVAGDDDKTEGVAVDISSMLQPAAPGSTKGSSGKNDADQASDNLDDEMRRLLGEIAGEPEPK
jgi:flagellar protein FliO/FliZ